ncbi:DNA-directed RNA polymerase core subunit rpc10 [Ascosphaera aggregata]|nr:DNA-directed RNA polymerase core subunit rpc10 [Ascosphaera aggregata]
MSREAYQVPSMSTAQTGYVEGSTSDNIFVTYICGDCSARVSLKRSDPIRCKECGHRVLYKERTARMVQFQAR